MVFFCINPKSLYGRRSQAYTPMLMLALSISKCLIFNVNCSAILLQEPYSNKVVCKSFFSGGVRIQIIGETRGGCCVL